MTASSRSLSELPVGSGGHACTLARTCLIPAAPMTKAARAVGGRLTLATLELASGRPASRVAGLTLPPPRSIVYWKPPREARTAVLPTINHAGGGKGSLRALGLGVGRLSSAMGVAAAAGLVASSAVDGDAGAGAVGGIGSAVACKAVGGGGAAVGGQSRSEHADDAEAVR